MQHALVRAGFDNFPMVIDMKRFTPLSLLLLLTTAAVQAQVPCTLGMAGANPCLNVDLMAVLPNSALAAGGTGADIWGWTDPLNGREYAIMSHSTTTSFTDITDPTLPVYLGFLQGPAVNALWRDVKVFNNHAYVVGDFGPLTDHGVQIFDLTQLRGQTGTPPVEFAQTNVYFGPPGNSFGENHNLWINEQTGFGYLVAGDSCGGGMHVMDLNVDPANPVFVGCIDTTSQTGGALVVHDTQCVIYHGPDTDHQGKEICFNANEDELHIVDVTDKVNFVVLAKLTYAGFSYVHQGTLTEDHAYFLSNDETDELDALTAGSPQNTNTYLWDVRDLDNPVQMPTYTAASAAIDHNMYVRGQYLFQSNYTAGLRILDISDIANNGNIFEYGFFDTHPASDATTFAGSWSNYAFFPSGTIIVSDIDDGLYILRANLPADFDNDYIADSNDNCTLVQNPRQRDTDSDGFGNYCDADLSNNCVVNFIDLGLMRSLYLSASPDADLNGNGVVNLTDVGIMKAQFLGAPGPTALPNICQ